MRLTKEQMSVLEEAIDVLVRKQNIEREYREIRKKMRAELSVWYEARSYVPYRVNGKLVMFNQLSKGLSITVRDQNYNFIVSGEF
jgi:hypothetical protein